MHFLPSAHVLVCITGVGQLLPCWADALADTPDIEGIEQACELATRELPAIYSSLSPPAELTSTVYQFGFSARAGRVIGFEHKSAFDFAGKPLAEGLHAYPPDALDSLVASTPSDRWGHCSFYIRLFDEMRRLDQAGPTDVRVGVGGHLELAHLTREGCTSDVVHQFASS